MRIASFSGDRSMSKEILGTSLRTLIKNYNEDMIICRKFQWMKIVISTIQQSCIINKRTIKILMGKKTSIYLSSVCEKYLRVFATSSPEGNGTKLCLILAL